MFGSTTLEVILGLVLLYLLLSTVCSAGCEWILHTFRPRSGLLKETLHELFSYTPGKDGALDFFFQHGLIRSSSNREPTYIAPRMFAAAVVDALIPDGPNAPPPAVAELKKQAAALPASRAKDAILAMLDLAENDLRAAIHGIESWYEDTMNRISGVYKRRVQWVLFLTGMGLAVLLNADTLMIARTLSANPALRQRVAMEAELRAKSPAPGQPGSPPIDPNVFFSTAKAELFSSALPLGWSNTPGDMRAYPWRTAKDESAAHLWLSKFAGLLITAAAVSFGAPFWFDLLNKVSNLRAAGPKPRKEDEE